MKFRLFFILTFISFSSLSWGEGNSFLPGLSNLNNKEEIQKLILVFKDNPFQKMSPSELHAHFLNQSKGSKLEMIFLKYPDTLNATVALVQDREAVPNLLEILLKEKELKQYGLIVLFLLLLSFVLPRWLISKEWGFLKRLFYRLILNLGFLGLNLFVFYSFFKSELDPSLNIISRYLF